jgi:outer membrane protein
MEKTSKFIKATLGVATVVLLSASFASCSKSEKSATSTQPTTQEIVYINTDSLLVNYEFAKDLNDQLMKKEEMSRADFNEQARVFQQDAGEFQRKVQNNGFLSMDRARQEQERLARREQELQALNQKLSGQLMQEQNVMNKQLRDTLVNFLKEIQPKLGFKVVLSNTMGDNVLYAQPENDITQKVLQGLNARYAKTKK